MLCICALTLSSCTSKATQTGQTQGQTSSPPTLTYVAIGASDTFGIGTSNPYTQNWAADLATMLGNHTHLINLGIPDITVNAALTTELPVALDSHPQLVTIWLAVNDLADHVPVENYSHDLDLLLQRLQTASPHAQIEVGNVPDLTSVPAFYDENPFDLRDRIDAYNSAISSIVQRHHVILVDLSAQKYNLQEFPQYISNDGLHPSAAGYLRLAELFYEPLQKG